MITTYLKYRPSRQIISFSSSVLVHTIYTFFDFFFFPCTARLWLHLWYLYLQMCFHEECDKYVLDYSIVHKKWNKLSSTYKYYLPTDESSFWTSKGAWGIPLLSIGVWRGWGPTSLHSSHTEQQADPFWLIRQSPLKGGHLYCQIPQKMDCLWSLQIKFFFVILLFTTPIVSLPDFSCFFVF